MSFHIEFNAQLHSSRTPQMTWLAHQSQCADSADDMIGDHMSTPDEHWGFLIQLTQTLLGKESIVKSERGDTHIYKRLARQRTIEKSETGDNHIYKRLARQRIHREIRNRRHSHIQAKNSYIFGALVRQNQCVYAWAFHFSRLWAPSMLSKFVCDDVLLVSFSHCRSLYTCHTPILSLYKYTGKSFFDGDCFLVNLELQELCVC